MDRRARKNIKHPLKIWKHVYCLLFTVHRRRKQHTHFAWNERITILGIDVIDRSPRIIRVRLLLLFYFESTCSSRIYRRYAKKKDLMKQPFNFVKIVSHVEHFISPISNFQSHITMQRKENNFAHEFLRHVFFLLCLLFPSTNRKKIPFVSKRKWIQKRSEPFIRSEFRWTSHS